jgi:ribonuclease H2 subunit C
MSPTDKLLPQSNGKRPPEGNGIPGGNPSADSDDEQPEEIKVMEEHASFDEIVVWGHEALPDTSTDPYAKGIEEWIEFAGRVSE